MVLYPNKLPESERVCFGICKLTDILLDDFELMEPDNLKRNLDLVQFFRFYAGLIEKLHPQSK